MLTSELTQLVETVRRTRAEAQTTEVKAANKGCPARLYDTLSSFSNQDGGGKILFGLSEKEDFAVVGVYDLQDLQKKVTEQCNQMEPPVRGVFTAAQYEGKDVCCIEVPALDLAKRPCYYRGSGMVRGSFVRVGDADLPMTNYEIYSYEAYRSHDHAENRTVERAAFDMLDREKLEQYLREKKKERPQLSVMEDRQIYELLGVTSGGAITLAAYMNFGIYPQGFFPQLSITAVVVPGYSIGDVTEDNARFVDNKRISGPLSDMVEDAVEFCKRNMKIKTIIDEETGKRADKTEYPLYAVREAILNAVIHRDYSVHTEGTPIQIDFFQDRLEIRSPGTLYGRMTVDQLGFARPDLRNPAMAMMAECLTEAENRYSGIPTIRREMKKYGLEPPVFENRRNEFVVILYNETHQKERRQRDELYLRERERQGAAPVSVREQRLLYDGEADSFIYGRAETPGPSEVSELSGPFEVSEAPGTPELSGPSEVSEASVSPGASGAAGDSAEQRILAYCRQPRLKSEIAALLGIQTSFYVMKRYVTPLVKAGKLALTLPEKPQSKLQRYVTTGK